MRILYAEVEILGRRLGASLNSRGVEPNVDGAERDKLDVAGSGLPQQAILI